MNIDNLKSEKAILIASIRYCEQNYRDLSALMVDATLDGNTVECEKLEVGVWENHSQCSEYESRLRKVDAEIKELVIAEEVKAILEAVK